MNQLNVACETGDIETVEHLLSDINCKTKLSSTPNINTDYSPLHYACMNGHTVIVKLLLSNNFDFEAEVNTSEHPKFRPIHFACDKGHTDIVELLLSRNCDFEAESYVRYYFVKIYSIFHKIIIVPNEADTFSMYEKQCRCCQIASFKKLQYRSGNMC